MINYASLGSPLYVPCTRTDLLSITLGEKYPFAKSIILCMEDSVSEQDLPIALNRLSKLIWQLKQLNQDSPYAYYKHKRQQTFCLNKRLPLCFIRVRNPKILNEILMLDSIAFISGFVLPKITQHNFLIYETIIKDFMAKKISHYPIAIMPTLETKEVFDQNEMLNLRELMINSDLKPNILMLRIGGNDLLSVLRLKRPRNMTIYETPIGQLIGQLIMMFNPFGFNLSSPVFEYLNEPEILTKEIQSDLAFGLVSKAAIHPDQIQQIEKHYRILRSDYELAKSILARQTTGVFKMQHSMCEPATHTNWALDIMEKSHFFPIVNTLN